MPLPPELLLLIVEAARKDKIYSLADIIQLSLTCATWRQILISRIYSKITLTVYFPRPPRADASKQSGSGEQTKIPNAHRGVKHPLQDLRSFYSFIRFHCSLSARRAIRHLVVADDIYALHAPRATQTTSSEEDFGELLEGILACMPHLQTLNLSSLFPVDAFMLSRRMKEPGRHPCSLEELSINLWDERPGSTDQAVLRLIGLLSLFGTVGNLILRDRVSNPRPFRATIRLPSFPSHLHVLRLFCRAAASYPSVLRQLLPASQPSFCSTLTHLRVCSITSPNSDPIEELDAFLLQPFPALQCFEFSICAISATRTYRSPALRISHMSSLRELRLQIIITHVFLGDSPNTIPPTLAFARSILSSFALPNARTFPQLTLIIDWTMNLYERRYDCTDAFHELDADLALLDEAHILPSIRIEAWDAYYEGLHTTPRWTALCHRLFPVCHKLDTTIVQEAVANDPRRLWAETPCRMVTPRCTIQRPHRNILTSHLRSAYDSVVSRVRSWFDV
ncbi:hypothetical protein NM688_g2072 [Phlebia brevispora]|uniref:Uncharacterized protein n=1 Tax=Phlebia brevispora TaxID=194682 RepID=A0ACC1T9X3_9APHY|nr:hypothetical protein NM688_g2072 [Phlebia brevispora]